MGLSSLPAVEYTFRLPRCASPFHAFPCSPRHEAISLDSTKSVKKTATHAAMPLTKVHCNLNIIGWRTIPFKNFELDSGFRRSDERWKGKVWFFFVIPVEAGIQDPEKTKSMPRLL
jgi:hypothetical protein